MPEYPPPIQHADFLDPLIAPGAPPPRSLFGIRSPFNRGVHNAVAQPVVELEELHVTSHRTQRSSQRSFSSDPGEVIRSNSREKRFKFIPVHEQLWVDWRIRGAAHVTALTLYVYMRGRAAPLFTRRLTYAAGDCPERGRTTFDGHMAGLVVAHAGAHVAEEHDLAGGNFPDDVLTVEHAPYKLKLVIEDPGGNLVRTKPARWLFLDVLLGGLELTWGPRAMLAPSPPLPSNSPPPHVERDHQVYDALVDAADAENLGNALPAPGQTKRVYLQANIFYRAEPELVENFNWEQLRAVWGEGPNIPIQLTPGVLRSDGQRVTGLDAVPALGAMTFAWEWIDAAKTPPAEVHDVVPSTRLAPGQGEQGQTAAQTFLTQATNFDSAITTPPGRNCHVERGGKRGPGAPAVFPPHAADAVFPYGVTNPAAGNWCAVSTLVRVGPNAGTTGVLFQPSIQPGDAFRLRVAPIYPGSVDPAAAHADFHEAIDEIPAAIRAETGAFEVWKTVRHVLLSANPDGLNPGHTDAVERRFAKLFIRIRTEVQPLGAYTAALTGIYDNTGPSAAQLELPVRLALLGAAAHMNNSYGVYFKTWDQWRLDLIAHHGNVAAAGAWASAYTHPTRDFWRNEFGLVPFAEPWPIHVNFVDNPVVGDVSVHANITGGRVPQVVDVNAPDVGALRAAARPSFYAFFIDAMGQYRTGDPPLNVTLTCQPVDRALAQTELEQAIVEANNEQAQARYNYTLNYAWAFRVIELALNDMLGAEDGLITVQFKQVTQVFGGPSAKAYFAPASRASIFIFMLKENEMEGTLCHEFGHAMFVNHQFYEQPDNDPRELHDEAVPHVCTMSTPAAQRNFCGFCMLRLRSWSIYQLNAARAAVPVMPVPVPAVPNMHVRTLTRAGAANTR